MSTRVTSPGPCPLRCQHGEQTPFRSARHRSQRDSDVAARAAAMAPREPLTSHLGVPGSPTPRGPLTNTNRSSTQSKVTAEEAASCQDPATPDAAVPPLCRGRPADAGATGLHNGTDSGGPRKALSSRIRAVSVSSTVFQNLLLNVIRDSLAEVHGGLCEESPKRPAPRPQAPQPRGQAPKPSMAEASWPGPASRDAGTALPRA